MYETWQSANRVYHAIHHRLTAIFVLLHLEIRKYPSKTPVHQTELFLQTKEFFHQKIR